MSPARRVVSDEPKPSGRARHTDLVLHIGLHKTASTYVQGVLAACRDDLLDAGLLYPRAGLVDKSQSGTRAGAGSGQARFARPGRVPGLRSELDDELSEQASTLLISSEEFARPGGRPPPDRLLARFRSFRSIRVVLVLRRQDDWVESYYKQVVDQYRSFEARSFSDFVSQAGGRLLDFHARFSPWRELVGAENFHVLSYDDLDGGAAICRRIVEICGVRGPVLDRLAAVPVPRYDSIRAIDTLGLRILNSYRLEDRDTRTRIARSIYEIAPAGDIELLTPDIREQVQARCSPVNERIEQEWFGEPVPGFRFGRPPRSAAPTSPTGRETVDYVDRVISLCEDGRGSSDSAMPRGGRAGE